MKSDLMAGNPDPNRRLAREMRAARAYSGKSRIQVAEFVGLSDETIGRYERGDWDKEPRKAFLRAFLDANDIPQAWRDIGFLAPDDPATRFADAARREAQRQAARPGSSPEAHPGEGDAAEGH